MNYGIVEEPSVLQEFGFSRPIPVYSVTTAYLATRLNGYPEYLSEQPENILNKEQMIQLQQILIELEFDVGGLDGILGAKTRQAVRSLQILLGLPADSWPTLELLTLLTN